MLESILLSPDWDVPDNVSAYVTTRHGGDSAAPYASFNLADHVGDSIEAVQRNRETLAAMLPVDLQFQWLQQVHGTDITNISNVQHELKVDAVSTRVPGIVCCVLTADCLPVFLASKNGDEVALVHAGWRGLAGGILENSVGSLANPVANLIAWLGPAIGPCHFEVGPEVRQTFLQTDGECLSSCFIPVAGTHKHMADLYSIARYKLQQLGVNSVGGGEHCSFCNDDQFYSYRRDGVTGRNLSLIYLD